MDNTPFPNHNLSRLAAGVAAAELAAGPMRKSRLKYPLFALAGYPLAQWRSGSDGRASVAASPGSKSVLVGRWNRGLAGIRIPKGRHFTLEDHPRSIADAIIDVAQRIGADS